MKKWIWPGVYLLLVVVLSISLYQLNQTKKYSNVIFRCYTDSMRQQAYVPVDQYDDYSLFIAQNLVWAYNLTSIQYIEILTGNRNLIDETYIATLDFHRSIVIKKAKGEDISGADWSKFEALKKFCPNLMEFIESTPPDEVIRQIEDLRSEVGN